MSVVKKVADTNSFADKSAFSEKNDICDDNFAKMISLHVLHHVLIYTIHMSYNVLSYTIKLLLNIKCYLSG